MRRGEHCQDLFVRCRECFTPVFGNGTSSLGFSIREEHTSASISLIYYPPMSVSRSVQSEKDSTKTNEKPFTFSTVVDMMPVVPNYATEKKKVSSIVPFFGLLLMNSQCLRASLFEWFVEAVMRRAQGKKKQGPAKGSDSGDAKLVCVWWWWWWHESFGWDFGGVNFWFVACGRPMMSAFLLGQTAFGKQALSMNIGS